MRVSQTDMRHSQGSFRCQSKRSAFAKLLRWITPDHPGITLWKAYPFCLPGLRVSSAPFAWLSHRNLVTPEVSRAHLGKTACSLKQFIALSEVNLWVNHINQRRRELCLCGLADGSWAWESERASLTVSFGFPVVSVGGSRCRGCFKGKPRNITHLGGVSPFLKIYPCVLFFGFFRRASCIAQAGHIGAFAQPSWAACEIPGNVNSNEFEASYSEEPGKIQT